MDLSILLTRLLPEKTDRCVPQSVSLKLQLSSRVAMSMHSPAFYVNVKGDPPIHRKS